MGFMDSGESQGMGYLLATCKTWMIYGVVVHLAKYLLHLYKALGLTSATH